MAVEWLGELVELVESFARFRDSLSKLRSFVALNGALAIRLVDSVRSVGDSFSRVGASVEFSGTSTLEKYQCVYYNDNSGWV